MVLPWIHHRWNYSNSNRFICRFNDVPMEIIEASQLPEGEKVYLKKDYLGWRVVEPWKDPETKKINWFNFVFSGKKGLVFLLVILILCGGFYVGVNELIADYKLIADNPCDYCSDCHAQCTKVIEQMHDLSTGSLNINWSNKI